MDSRRNSKTCAAEAARAASQEGRWVRKGEFLMPFITHPKTKVTLFVGQKDFEKHQAEEQKQKAEAKKSGQKKYKNPRDLTRRDAR